MDFSSESKNRLAKTAGLTRKRSLQSRKAYTAVCSNTNTNSNTNMENNRRVGRRNSSKTHNLVSEDDENIQLFERVVERNTTDVWLNKKAMSYDLFGGCLKVPANKYNPRRDYITAKQVTPAELHHFLPKLSPYEHLAGDVFEFTSNRKVLKDPITLALPVHLFSRSKLFELKVKARLVTEEQQTVKGGADDQQERWEYVEGIKLLDDNESGEFGKLARVEFETPYLGAFVPILASTAEMFTVTEQGVLYTARLNHYISLRFPKRALLDTMEVALRIIPLNEDKIEVARSDYKDHMHDFELSSDFFEFLCPETNFKRSVTVKLPLPATGFTSEHHESIAVLQRSSSDGSIWRLVESQLKFTTTTVSFETRSLGRFCIVRGHPKRKQRFTDSITAIEHLNWRWKRDVLIFTQITRKAWNVWVELSPPDGSLSLIDKRESEGMTCVYRPERLVLVTKSIEGDEEEAVDAIQPPAIARIRKTLLPSEKSVTSYAQLRAKNRRSSSAACEDALRPAPPAHESGRGPAVWVTADDGVVHITRPERVRQCPVYLNSSSSIGSYRCFEIEPVVEQYDRLSATLSIYTDDIVPSLVSSSSSQTSVNPSSDGKRNNMAPPQQPMAGNTRTRIATVTIPLTREMMQDYFYVPPEPIEVPLVEDPSDASLPSDEKKDEPKAKRFFSPEYMARLTISRRAKQTLSKEPKVLSGRSLQTLSRQIEEGLTLAVHLHVPDSTITGIGFDALANGLSLSEVTYKILLRWKRMPAAPLDKLNQLSDALKVMGRHDIVSILWQYHGNNKELTPDVFSHLYTGDDPVMCG